VSVQGGDIGEGMEKRAQETYITSFKSSDLVGLVWTGAGILTFIGNN
jgi:hypothetical protein